MASRDLNDLIPEMESKARELIELCDSKGVEILIYCTYRSPEEQARLFRQGRPYSQIKNKMDRMSKAGFDFLADIIDKVGPQYDKRKVTYAGPGESWHNWKEAFDSVPVVGGKALWNDNEKYKIYGECAMELGLEWGGSWSRFKDKPHVQYRSGANPLKVFSPDEIKDLLRI